MRVRPRHVQCTQCNMINGNLLKLDIGCAVQLDYESGAILLLLMAVDLVLHVTRGLLKTLIVIQ